MKHYDMMSFCVAPSELPSLRICIIWNQGKTNGERIWQARKSRVAKRKRKYRIFQVEAVLILQVFAENIYIDFHVTEGAGKESPEVVIFFWIIQY